MLLAWYKPITFCKILLIYTSASNLQWFSLAPEGFIQKSYTFCHDWGETDSYLNEYGSDLLNDINKWLHDMWLGLGHFTECWSIFYVLINVRHSILVLLHCYLITMTALSNKVQLGNLVIFYLVWNLLATSDRQHSMEIEFLARIIILLSKQNSFTNLTLFWVDWVCLYIG